MLDNFFVAELPARTLNGTYTPTLVALSYLVASFASYTGLSIAGKMTRARSTRAALFYFIVGAFSLGGGIWSMHFIGMLAFHMDDAPAMYSPLETVLSMCIAVVIALGVLRMTQVKTLTFRTLAGSALLLGAAICGMHYVGMSAMTMKLVEVKYIPSLFILSIIIAVTASAAALWIFFHLSRLADSTLKRLLRVAAALVMGAAICGMHYTGMLAAVFIPLKNFCVTSGMPAESDNEKLGLWIAGVTSLLLGTALALSLCHRGQAFFSGKSDIQAFPTRMLSLSMFMTVVSLAGLMAHSYYIHQSISGIAKRDIGGLAAAIQEDQANDARMARIADALDGDGRPPSAGNSFAAGGDLILLNMKIQDALEHHKIAAARAIFGSSAYKKLLAAHEHAVSNRIQQGIRDSQQELDGFSEGIYYTVYFFIASLPVQIVIWAFTLLALRHWRRELVRAKAAAEAASRSKGEFLANMSHELRTPMNGIIGLTQLLAEGETMPEKKELIDAVKRSSESLLFLLNDILDFSKIEAGQLALEEAPFSLKDSLKSVIDLLSVIASKKGLVLNYRYAPDVPANFVGDALRINQIATNLIGNAIKFTEAGHVDLTVDARRNADGSAGGILLTVRDTGIGIPADKRDKLFNKFTQVDASTTRRYGGTGLGLAITKMLVEKMQGAIRFESVTGAGTTFAVSLPLKAAEDTDVAAVRASGSGVLRPEHDFSRYQVLVVDDHPVNLLFARKLLKKIGFTRIDEAVNGAEALARIWDKGARYDLVLMDCQMPEVDGFDAVRQIREMERVRGLARLPVVAMTAHAMEGDRQKCLEAGMDDYLSKPVNPDKLVSTLSRMLVKSPIQPIASPAAAIDPPAPASAPMAAPRAKLVTVPIVGVNPATNEAQKLKSPAIEIERLALFTEGDQALEKELSDAYISAGKETVASLRDHLNGRTRDDDWRIAAHRLKGASAQIGARGLAEICLAAEKEYKGGLESKQAMLHDIESVFEEVQAFLRARLGGPDQLSSV